MLQSVAKHLTRFIERFFPTDNEDQEEQRRATIFAWICVGIVFIITLLTIIDVFTANLQYLVQILAFNTFVAMLLFFLKRGVRVSTLSNIFMSVSFAFTVFLIFDSWGILSPLIIYLTIIPALVALIAEVKWVTLWTFAGAAAVTMFFVLHKMQIIPTEIVNVDYFLTNAVSNYISAIAFIAILFVYSESSRKKARTEVLTAMKRSDDLLLNILPEETARELKEVGTSPAKLYSSATVLFTDFKGFTAISQQMGPEQVVMLLNDYFMHFDQICDKYQLEKIKTIGDAYLAVGGLPTTNPHSVVNTVIAGLEMQAFVAKRKAALQVQNRPAFEMRVGIHTGPVVAGIVGIKKFQYDIWGDTVNTASRMESSGEVGKVNVSESTYELLKHKPEFTFESRGKIEAKGKGEIEMYYAYVNANQ